ncbi:hypothetical protein HRbin01_01247 [archaeon HR01]|nr:hypothetical protein HRbin01_01247 [archaeon HR01]
MSSLSLSAEDFQILRWVGEVCGNSEPCILFEFAQDSGEIRAVGNAPQNMSVTELVDRLDILVQRGLVNSIFHKKVLQCVLCGNVFLRPKTACPSCNSEDTMRSAVYIHSCGASIPEQALKNLTSCPKCRDTLDKSSFTVVDYRFLCNSCGNLFPDPATFVECSSCGWVDMVKNADQIVLRRYALTAEGRSLLESADPSKLLVRRLVDSGYNVREKVRVVGLSGTSHLIDVVAVSRDRSETKLYTVMYRVTANDLISSTVRRLDIEKTAVEGVAGRVRWVVAGVQVDESAVRVAQTFGVEVEKI